MRRECRERFPRHRLQRKPLVSDLSMHHGTCVTHVPWCLSGSLTGGVGKNISGITGACATRNCTYLVRGPWYLYFRAQWWPISGRMMPQGLTALKSMYLYILTWPDLLKHLRKKAISFVGMIGKCVSSSIYVCTSCWYRINNALQDVCSIKQNLHINHELAFYQRKGARNVKLPP